jgi:hypothetical protein
MASKPVVNSDTIVCKGCKIPLRDMKKNEEWYCLFVRSFYACKACFTLHIKPAIDEYNEQQRDLTTKMPLSLDKVEEAIKSHRNYDKLGETIRRDFEYIVADRMLVNKRTKADKKNLRLIWTILYHGNEVYDPV